MKKIYLVIIIFLTCYPFNSPISATTLEQREFAQEAIALRFRSSPVLAPKAPLLTYSTQRAGYKFSFSGYLKTDIFWDSWQVRGSAQDHFLFFPEEPVFDRCGRDINRNGRFNILAIESRLRLEIEGPQVFGARCYGVIEPDFRGGDLVAFVNIMHLVQTFMYLDWKDKSLLIGQYFHPIFPAEFKCFPMTVSYNFGLPIEPYAFEPQIRFTKQVGALTFVLSLLSHSQRFYGGPLGRSSMYSRDAIMPNMNALMVGAIGKHRIGFGIDMTRIVPRIRTNLALAANQSLKTYESLVSFLALCFLVLDYKNVILKFKAIWSQNGSGYAMTSGYGVHCRNPLTDERTYANTQIVNAWMDVTLKNFMPFEPGYFLGLSKNLGSATRIIPSINGVETVYTPGNRHHMDYLLRFSPRLRWYSQPFVVGAELEFTRALWGELNDYARVVNTTPVNNVRLLFGAYYYF